MKKLFFIGFFALAGFQYTGAQTYPQTTQPTAPNAWTETYPQTIQPTAPTKPAATKPTALPNRTAINPPNKTGNPPINPTGSTNNVYTPISSLPYFLDPGIIGYSNGKWIGTDHLYNLTDELGVIVEIVREPGRDILLDEKIIEANVLEMFKKAGMRAFPLTGGPTSPLPFYHVLIITMPMPNGQIGYVDCRLFENVTLPRVQLADGIFFQAITWEDQTLVQTATRDFEPHIYNDVKEITDNFIKRYKHFQEMRSRFGR